MQILPENVNFDIILKTKGQLMKQKVNVAVAGTSFTVVAEDAPEYIADVARTVNDRINAVSLQSPGCTKLKAAALCAMEYCSACMKKDGEIENLRAEITKLKTALGEADNG